MDEDDRFSTTLTPVRGDRSYGGALAALAITAVLIPLAYLMGPDALIGCQGTNPFDRLGLWLAQGAHVDGAEGAPSCLAPHPVTWAVICVIAGGGFVSVVIALRRH